MDCLVKGEKAIKVLRQTINNDADIDEENINLAME